MGALPLEDNYLLWKSFLFSSRSSSWSLRSSSLVYYISSRMNYWMFISSSRVQQVGEISADYSLDLLEYPLALFKGLLPLLLLTYEGELPISFLRCFDGFIISDLASDGPVKL